MQYRRDRLRIRLYWSILRIKGCSLSEPATNPSANVVIRQFCAWFSTWTKLTCRNLVFILVALRGILHAEGAKEPQKTRP